MEKYQGIIAEIVNDRVSGGKALGYKAINLLEQLVSDATSGKLNEDDVIKVLKELRKSRKLMGIIFNAGDLCIKSIRKGGNWVENLKSTVNNLKHLLDNSSKEILKFSKKIIKCQSTVTTISFSSNVYNVVKSNRDNVKILYLLESRPGIEVKAAYEAYRKLNLDVKVVPDSNMFYALKKSDIVLIGADAITLRDGFLIHKAGTSALLTLAKSMSIESVIIAEALKIIDTNVGHLPAEVWEYEIPLLNMKTQAYPFDRCPIKIANMLITDLGIIKPISKLRILETYINLLLRVFD